MAVRWAGLSALLVLAPQVHTSKQPISANGAFHPFGIVLDRLINGA